MLFYVAETKSKEIKKKNPEHKKVGMGTHPQKKYKANKSTRTHVMKEHNNWDTTNTLKK
jgi:hypothetical protein